MQPCRALEPASLPRCALQRIALNVKRRPERCVPPRCASVPAATPAAAKPDHVQPELLEERGVRFSPGKAFYRAESAQGRDLAILAACAYKEQTGTLLFCLLCSTAANFGVCVMPHIF